MPSPDQPTPGDPADPPVHLVATPMGSEGPYALAELRALVAAGRINPDDRVMHTGTGRAGLVADLIPDAAELSAKAERVRRRSTSGAHPAQKSQARRFRTPLPIAAAEPASQPAPQPAPPPRIPRPLVLSGILAALIVVLAGFIAVVYDSVVGPPPAQSQIASWKVAKLGQAGGPWILDLDETSLTVTAPDGGRQRLAMERTVLDRRHVRLKLSPPHPVLGAEIDLRGTDAIEVGTASASGHGELLP